MRKNPAAAMRLFLTTKVRLHCDRVGFSHSVDPCLDLFLTSKVRLHCDEGGLQLTSLVLGPFPDLKGQAPLRPLRGQDGHPIYTLFLTSKVRLHCDRIAAQRPERVPSAFPDLKGQAPLRPHRRPEAGAGALGFS